MTGRGLGRDHAVWTSGNRQKAQQGTDPGALLPGHGQRAQGRRSEMSIFQYELGRKVLPEIDRKLRYGEGQRALHPLHDLDPGLPRGNAQRVLHLLHVLDPGRPHGNDQGVLNHLHGLDPRVKEGDPRALNRPHDLDPRAPEGY